LCKWYHLLSSEADMQSRSRSRPSRSARLALDMLQSQGIYQHKESLCQYTAVAPGRNGVRSCCTIFWRDNITPVNSIPCLLYKTTFSLHFYTAIVIYHTAWWLAHFMFVNLNQYRRAAPHPSWDIKPALNPDMEFTSKLSTP